ncbi:MAG: metal ABC transporter permease, partial [Candidatus Hinthialibacter sp.]
MEIIENFFDPWISEADDYLPLIGVIFIALSCSILSTFAAVKRMTLAGVGIGGTVYAGAALGLLLFPALNLYDWPILVAAAAGGALAALLGFVFQINRVLPTESVYGVLIVSLLGFLLVAHSEWGERLAALHSYLLDAPPVLSLVEFYCVFGLSAVTILIVILFYRGFAAVCIDQDYAMAAGVPVRLLETLLWLLFLGVLLISIYATGFLFTLSLILFPGLCARMIT